MINKKKTIIRDILVSLSYSFNDFKSKLSDDEYINFREDLNIMQDTIFDLKEVINK